MALRSPIVGSSSVVRTCVGEIEPKMETERACTCVCVCLRVDQRLPGDPGGPWNPVAPGKQVDIISYSNTLIGHVGE